MKIKLIVLRPTVDQMSTEKAPSDAPNVEPTQEVSSEGTWQTPSDPMCHVEVTPAPPVEEDPDYIPMEEAVSRVVVL